MSAGAKAAFAAVFTILLVGPAAAVVGTPASCVPPPGGSCIESEIGPGGQRRCVKCSAGRPGSPFGGIRRPGYCRSTPARFRPECRGALRPFNPDGTPR